MKKSLTIAIAPASMPASLVTTKIAARNRARKAAAKDLLISPATPPSEETVTRLNGIGREYPFCVYYKSKRYDPL
jgi:hypothetical protein